MHGGETEALLKWHGLTAATTTNQALQRNLWIYKFSLQKNRGSPRNTVVQNSWHVFRPIVKSYLTQPFRLVFCPPINTHRARLDMATPQREQLASTGQFHSSHETDREQSAQLEQLKVEDGPDQRNPVSDAHRHLFVTNMALWFAGLGILIVGIVLWTQAARHIALGSAICTTIMVRGFPKANTCTLIQSLT